MHRRPFCAPQETTTMSNAFKSKARGTMRRGRGKLSLDPEEMAAIWLQQEERGKGLIGGDPQRKPRWRHPHPAEPAPWYRHGLSSPEHQQRLAAFLTAAPLEVEIGAGDGRFITAWARQHPERHFFALETRWKYARRMFERAQKHGVENLWVSDNDARVVIPEVIPNASVEVFHILMPDPWWKPKHQAKRLIAPWFLAVLARKLKPGGVLRVETDVEGYPEFVQTLVAAESAFLPHNPALASHFADAPPTSRQIWCRERGIPIQQMFFQKQTGEEE